jgi:uncharacterized membrane protein
MSRALSNRIIFVLSLAGMGVALYLTLVDMNYLRMVCGAADNGCERVALHPSAHGFGIPALSGIPTAAFGVLMYLTLAVLSFVRVASSEARLQQRLSTFQWLISLAGVAVACGLTYMEANVIHAWCKYCVASAIIILLIFLTATIERFSAHSSPYPNSLAAEGEVS